MQIFSAATGNLPALVTLMSISFLFQNILISKNVTKHEEYVDSFINVNIYII
jgi:hypothetical protein